jgi:hypothetical protein
MIKKLFSLVTLVCFVSACGASTRAGRGPVTPKPFVTPWEYYQASRPADYRPSDQAQVQKTAVHSTGEDTKSDKVNMVLIGTLVGVLVVGGTVAGVLIAKNH